MNVEIWAKAALFPEKEYTNGIFVAVQIPARATTFGLQQLPHLRRQQMETALYNYQAVMYLKFFFVITISASNLYMPMIWSYVILLDFLIPFLCGPDLQCSWQGQGREIKTTAQQCDNMGFFQCISFTMVLIHRPYCGFDFSNCENRHTGRSFIFWIQYDVHS